MKNKELIIGIFAIVLVAAGAYYFLKSGKHIEEPKNIRVAYSKLALDNDLLLGIAEDQGFFQKNDVTVERKPQDKLPLAVTLSSDVDVTLDVLDGYTGAYLNDNDNLRWIASLSNYPSNFYAASRYSKEEASKIQNIGVGKLGWTDQIMSTVLAKDLFKITGTAKYILSETIAGKLAMLDRGDIDFAFITNFNAKNKVSGLSKYTVYEPTELFKDIYYPKAIITKSETISQRSIALEGFVKSMYEAIQYTKDNKDETVTYLKTKDNLNDADALEVYNEIQASRDNLKFVPVKENFQDRLKEVADVVKAENPTKDFAGFVYDKFAKLAIK